MNTGVAGSLMNAGVYKDVPRRDQIFPHLPPRISLRFCMATSSTNALSAFSSPTSSTSPDWPPPDLSRMSPLLQHDLPHPRLMSRRMSSLLIPVPFPPHSLPALSSLSLPPAVDELFHTVYFVLAVSSSIRPIHVSWLSRYPTLPHFLLALSSRLPSIPPVLTTSLPLYGLPSFTALHAAPWSSLMVLHLRLLFHHFAVLLDNAMNALATAADAEHTAGTLTPPQSVLYLADILRIYGLRPLDVHGASFDNSALVAPGNNDTIVAAEEDRIHLDNTLQVRASQGWAHPPIRIILQLDGVKYARCMLPAPPGYVAQDIATKRVHSFQAFVDGLP
ncbi:hypothetical protein C8R46DRAFT_1347797 [Mycena filopes]|nr:hypothetical protein C8R46DRAFT_1347797 [Mycena filopes]